MNSIYSKDRLDIPNEQSCIQAIVQTTLQVCYWAWRLTMAFNNYTLANGLPVHAVHVSRTDEDGKVQQERFWGTVKQIGDPSQVYVRIDIDELQPMFQGLHYGQETTEELSRRKRRRTAAEKREKAREEQLERLRRDQVAQQGDDTNWEQARIDLWRQKLEERERAVAARESAVFQRELEYRRLERCPLCGKRGRIGDVRRRRAAEQDETRKGNERRREEDIDRRADVGDAAAGASVEGRLDQGDRPRAGRILQRALEQRDEQAGNNDGGETWEQACVAQRMTPQRSPFQTGQAGSGVVVHGPLLRRQTPYPRFVVTTGAQTAQRPPPTNEEPPRNEDDEAVEDRGSCVRVQDGPADGGEWCAALDKVSGRVWDMLYDLVLYAILSSLS